MQFDENTPIPLPFDLSEHEISNLETSIQTFSQNYIDVLGDLIEPFPVQLTHIEIPYNETYSLEMKIQNTCRYLRQALRLKNRKQTLTTLFLLGQLIYTNDLSNKQAAEHRITRYYRRIALRVFHLFKGVGIQQILRSTKVTVRKVLNLKQHEFEQLIESTRFAGAQI